MEASLTDIAHTIQLAVAPVFLLTGIAAFLGVLSNRLGRITDRARILERRLPLVSEEHKEILQTELASLWKRVNMVHQSILLCTSSALLICLVVITLFAEDFSPINLQVPIALIFVAAMLMLVAGLLYFLREINKATRSMRAGLEIIVGDLGPE